MTWGCYLRAKYSFRGRNGLYHKSFSPRSIIGHAMRFDDPPPEPLASAPGFLLSWNGQRMAHKFAEALAPLDLRPPHFGVMTLIAAHPGCTQRQLVADSLIDPSSMVAVVDELEQMGLAERRPHA